MEKIIVVLLCGTLFFSCSKKDSFNGDSFCADGYIRWKGQPAADGLGWVFYRNTGRTNPYVLKNLPESFKRDLLNVNICLEETQERFSCYCTTGSVPYYEINFIERR